MRTLFTLLASLATALVAQGGISSFTAAPTVFLPGQDVTLSWSVTSGDVISISPSVGSVSGATGSVTVSPTAPTTYTLTDSTSSTAAQVTVTPYAPAQLIHRWSFNEGTGTTVNDSVGTAHGVVRGSGYSRTASGVILPGGSSSSAPYIDLPNGLISPLTDVTIEGWMTVNSAQNWARVFDFGNGTAGELTAPGGSANGSTYMLLSAQVGTDQTKKRLSMKYNNVETSTDIADSTPNGQQFHFAVVFDSTGNNGQPQVRYYKDGAYVGALNTTYRLSNISDVNNWLGRSNWTGDNNTAGTYNEFRIWDGAMNDSAVADNAAAGPDALPTSPRIDAFTALPATTIYRGSSVRLSYQFSYAGGPVNGSIDQGIGALPGTAGYVTVNPAATTTYTLTATSATGSRTASVTIYVIPSEPVAENGTVSVAYQTPTPVTLVAHDPNTAASQLTYAVVTQPAHGTLSGAGAALTYTPSAGYSGPDSFTFRANDGTSDSNVATVSITVNPAPVAPTDVTLSNPDLLTSYVSGSFVARLTAMDGNPDDRFTYTLVEGSGSTHNAFFTIAGNQLISAHSFASDGGQNISIRIRVTDSGGNFYEKVVTFPPVKTPALRVRINEINYNTPRNTIRGEYIELYNPFPTPVSLGGWRFTKGVDFTFPAGATIPANGYAVAAQDPTIIQALYGVTAYGPWNGGLSSDGDEIVLRDAAANVVDTVQYGITSPWPVPPNGDGPSLELIDPELDGSLGGHWRASVAAPATVSYLARSSSGWRYRKGTSEASSPTIAWRQEGFAEDASWSTGTAPLGLFKKNSDTSVATLTEAGVTLGTQLTDMATYSSGAFTTAYRSVFFRKTFNVSGTIPRAMLLRVMHNDAAIVWINGQEVARFGFQPNAPAEPAFNNTDYYERANDPWSDVVLMNLPALLHDGTNTIAILGFAKPPAPRPTGGGSTGQEDLANYNVFDFSIDAELRNVPEILGTPAAQNSTFVVNAPPAIRGVEHLPAAPHSWDPITFKARVSDLQGVGSVQLLYQVCPAGSFIPASLPLTVSQILANPRQALPANPAFENSANWQTVPMVDDGSVAGDTPGDGIFTARIPARAHRTLVRYRISATDLAGVSVRIPTADDPRKNYALYVYDGVPPYSSGGTLFAPETLTKIPVYQWVTRASDFSGLLAYNSSEQFANTIDLNVLEARRFENHEGALVVDDQVIDHAVVRLRGGNSRYNGSGKRHFRFKFPKGTPLEASDESGRKYPRKWEDMLFNKMFGNKGYYDWGLPYEAGGRLWRLQGIPIPESHWVHFRVVRGSAEAPDATNGDFWGLYQALEFPDGKNFLKARDLPAGNFYKMSDWMQSGEMDERYQAEGSVDYGEDFDNVRYNVHQTAGENFIRTYVNMPLWYRYNAVQEAVRHYDIFAEPTGRHRVKNLIWYFQPQTSNPLGQLWFMPYDWDASFGPNFNSGWDNVHNAIYNHADVADSPTWQLPKQNRTNMQIEHRNAIRELRDLIWYRDSGTNRGPFDDIVDDALATLGDFWKADRARWPSTGAIADNPGGAPFKAQDMKNFAFVGWTDAVGADEAIGAGGRAAYLDAISDGVDSGLLPNKPTITFNGSAGYPVDGITLQSSAFADPQGAATFGAMQWRIGEITDPTAPAYDATQPRVFEATAVWDSGELTAFNGSIAVPGVVLRAGHAYRARVRHRDNTGRWSHWSSPLQFTAGASNHTQVLRDNLMITEVMYHPAPPSNAEAAAGYLEGDFEFIELMNISPALTLDLSNVRFTKGVDFDFAGGLVKNLGAGARVLVVKNLAAFQMRYGSGYPIAGTWAGADNLANGGEQVKLSYGAGDAIQDFTYDDASPWPTEADLGGYSLVLRSPDMHPDHSKASNWRASYKPGGSPGGSDVLSYSEWATLNGAGAAGADDDLDGINNALEYVLAGNPNSSDRTKLPQVGVQAVNVNGLPGNYLTISFRYALASEQAARFIEWSSNLTEWNATGTRISATNHGDGTVTEVWRAADPIATGGPTFGRLRVIAQ